MGNRVRVSGRRAIRAPFSVIAQPWGLCDKSRGSLSARRLVDTCRALPESLNECFTIVSYRSSPAGAGSGAMLSVVMVGMVESREDGRAPPCVASSSIPAISRARGAATAAAAARAPERLGAVVGKSAGVSSTPGNTLVYIQTTSTLVLNNHPPFTTMPTGPTCPKASVAMLNHMKSARSAEKPRDTTKEPMSSGAS